MKRITATQKYGYAVTKENVPAALDKLGEYEDTGLTPYEIESLASALAASQRRERAAVEMIPQTCKTCKHELYCNFETQCFGTNKENWEWRCPSGAGSDINVVTKGENP